MTPYRLLVPFLKNMLHPSSGYKSASLPAEKSRDSSVGIATGYGLDARGIGVRFPSGARDFSLLDIVHTGCGAHPASYLMGSGSFLPGGKAAVA
jgi:hypothetical protein